MRQWLAGVVVVVVFVTSCSSSDGGGGGTSASTGPTGPVDTAAGVYVVQVAGTASLAPVDATGDSTELVLAGVPDESVVFTGAPDPRAASVPTSDVLDVLNTSASAHEAALSWSSPTAAGTLVVSVAAGRFDEATSTLRYEVRLLDPAAITSPAVAAKVGATDSPSSATTSTTTQLTETLPDDVTTSTLFIDPLGQDRAEANCNLTVTNASAFLGEVASINPTDRGGMADWDRPLTQNEPLAVGGTLTATSGESTWDCHAQVTFGFTLSDGDWYGVYLKLEDPVFSKSSWSCEGPPELSCAVTGNESGQPLNLTVVISD